MSIQVGYLQSSRDLERQARQVRALAAAGCQTVRVEAGEAPDKVFKPVLEAIAGFLGQGDGLVAPDITHLGSSPRAAEALLARLEARGVRIRLLESEAAHDLPGHGAAPTPASGDRGGLVRPAPRTIDAGTVRALSDHGFGPSQIARKLGISRMTVWRRLAAAGA